MAEASAAGGFRRTVLLLEPRLWRGMGPANAAGLARACGAEEIGLHVGELGPAAVEALRAAGFGVGAWGANHERSIRAGFDLGLDAIATDDPPLALRLRP